MSSSEEPLFEPDSDFAAGWCVDDPLAQGALKHASVTILDVLDDAWSEIGQSNPDVGDFSPLGVFPSAVRLALTPQMVSNVRCAAVIVGWKLAQPGTVMPPGCVAEELALEMIRQEAIGALELVEAPASSISATRGVFEVCQDDDVLDLFEMKDPGDASIALSDPINRQLGKADMRPEAWFEPFYGGQGHPVYSEPLSQARTPAVDRDLTVIEPSSNLGESSNNEDSGFRVVIRRWTDEFWQDNPDQDPMPESWRYLLDVPDAKSAVGQALDRYPDGAFIHSAFDDPSEVALGDPRVARVAVDVQRVGIGPIRRDSGAPRFHAIGTISDLPEDLLPTFAARIKSAFEAGVVARDSKKTYIAITVAAENFEQVDAEIDEVLIAVSKEFAIEELMLDGGTSGGGARTEEELMVELRSFRRWDDRFSE